MEQVAEEFLFPLPIFLVIGSVVVIGFAHSSNSVLRTCACMHRKLSQNTRDCYFWLLNIGAEREASNPTVGFSEKRQVWHHQCGFSAFLSILIGSLVAKVI